MSRGATPCAQPGPRPARGADERCDAESSRSRRPVSPPIVVAPTSVTHRDDLDVPRGLRIAGRLGLAAAAAGRCAGVAVLWLVGKLQLVVVPLLIALLLSALLSPLVGLLLRAKVPRSLATAIVMIAGIAAVAGTLNLVINQFIDGRAGADRPRPPTASGQIQDWLKTGPLHLTDDQLNGLANERRELVHQQPGHADHRRAVAPRAPSARCSPGCSWCCSPRSSSCATAAGSGAS